MQDSRAACRCCSRHGRKLSRSAELEDEAGGCMPAACCCSLLPASATVTCKGGSTQWDQRRRCRCVTIYWT